MQNNNFEEFYLPYEERWENLTLANDFMFGKVFSDLELCLELIQMILPELKIERIKFPELQKSVKETFDTKGVRFDVYVHDDKERIIDVEMQPVKRDNLMKRTRAYHSIIDLDAMNKDTVKKYDDMPEAIVIFICDFDLFHLHRHIYTFKNFCVQDKNLMLDDGAATIFLSTKGKLNDVSPKLKAFLNFVCGKTSDEPFVKKLEHKLFESKQNFKWRQEYMLGKFERNATLEEGFARGRIEGHAEGRVEGITIGEMRKGVEIARRLRQSGMNDFQIHSITDLSFDDIKNLS